jgi:hypothetical protein
VETNFSKFHLDYAAYKYLFMNNFVDMALKGPNFAQGYLREKKAQAKAGWQAMRQKLRAAEAINAEVTSELNTGIYTCFYTKFASELAMNALGAGLFGSISFLANSLVSIGYTATCKFVEYEQEADGAQVIGWVDGASLGTNIAGNYAQEITENNALKYQNISDTLRAEIKDLSNKGAYQHGRKNLELLEKSLLTERQYLKNLDKVRSANFSAGLAKAGSFAVGLLFMGPQIKTALTGDLRRMEGRPEVKSTR